MEKAKASYKPAREWIGAKPRSQKEESVFETMEQARKTMMPFIRKELEAEHVSGELLQMRLRA